MRTGAVYLRSVLYAKGHALLWQDRALQARFLPFKLLIYKTVGIATILLNIPTRNPATFPQPGR
jgi:hypothetical protein